MKSGYLKAKMKVKFNLIEILEKEASTDTSIFWTSSYVYVAAWLGLFLWNCISFNFVWAIIAFIMLIFAGTNLYGFIKCSKEQQGNIMKFGAKTMIKAANKGAEVAKNQV